MFIRVDNNFCWRRRIADAEGAALKEEESVTRSEIHRPSLVINVLLLLPVQFLVVCDFQGDSIEQFISRGWRGPLHGIIGLIHAQNPSTLDDIIFQFVVVLATPFDSLPFLLQCRGQTLAGQLRQFSPFCAEGLVQVEQFQRWNRQFTEHWRENGQLQGRQRDLELRFDYLQWLVLDVQFLIRPDDVLQLVVGQGVQVQIEHLLKVRRNVAIDRLDQANLRLLRQVDRVRCDLMVEDVDVVELDLFQGNLVREQGDEVGENGHIRLLLCDVSILEHVSRATGEDSSTRRWIRVEASQGTIVGIDDGSSGEEGNGWQNYIQSCSERVDKLRL